MRKTVSTLLLLVFVAGAAYAQRDKAAEQKKAMEAMMRAGTPGDAHKKLAAMAGTYDAKVKMWMDPKTPPAESTGTAVMEMVLGGRWLQERFDGSMMGQPFSGIGYTGYDNIRQMYVGTWMDTVSTAAMSSQSISGDTSGKTFAFSASMPDAVSGEAVNFIEKMTMTDNDHMTWEMWGPDMGGVNYKMMEIVYSRKK